ncbi:MAG: hypothetical protein KDB27_34820 [Planctomycetales bacterium]|nr:hypothetical protein [Planctomycetales bacterium]
MKIEINLNANEFAAIDQLAAAAGVDVATYLQELVHIQLEPELEPMPRRTATAWQHGLTQIITFNGGDFTRYADVKVLSPHDVVA